jgi:hypothetical protein
LGDFSRPTIFLLLAAQTSFGGGARPPARHELPDRGDKDGEVIAHDPIPDIDEYY